MVHLHAKIDKIKITVIITYMKGNEIKNMDWTLLAISYAKEKGISPVRLQKSLFLLGEELRSIVGKKYYKFVPYNYGPFCKEIYQDVDLLAVERFIEVIPNENQRYFEYFLTQAGEDHLKKLSFGKKSVGAEYLKQAVEWALDLSFDDIITSIYTAYPKYQKNSVFHK